MLLVDFFYINYLLSIETDLLVNAKPMEVQLGGAKVILANVNVCDLAEFVSVLFLIIYF